jgi:CRISPR-associated endonuclease/helicase Cas3
MPNPNIAPQSGTVYLVCTSAGEVGVNISANHLICDLTPFDSMVQRFGRINRFGEGDARIDIVYCAIFGGKPSRKNTKSQYSEACKRTLELLQKLPKRVDERNNGSPAALDGLLHSLPRADREAAFTPLPDILPTTEILFDAWALTSIRDKLPGRPPTTDWLHGVSGWEPRVTYIAWRKDVEIIGPELQQSYSLEDLLEDYPLKPHELLRDTTERVLKHLETMAPRHPELFTWIVGFDGRIRVLSLVELVTKNREKDLANLANCTLILPPAAGGLENGMLRGDAEFEYRLRDFYDVADKWKDENDTIQRQRLWDNDERPHGMRLLRIIDTRSDAEDDLTEAPASTRRYWHWYVLPNSADDDGSRVARDQQELQLHLQKSERLATALAAKLLSGPDEARAVVLAAKWHDLGKRRSVWQRSIGNSGPNVPLAKSANKPWVEIADYRHEFGSLLDIADDPEFRALTPEVRDLVLHFIASHHGRARPHFPANEVFDPEYLEQYALETACEVPRRYAQLQRKYGRWGLAYLESLVRVADALASENNDSEEPLMDKHLAQARRRTQ